MAWGLFEKRDTESLNRVVSARTLDGQKVRAKLVLKFPKAVARTEADALMMKYARAYARAVEGELSGGTLPFDDLEVQRRLTDEVRDLPRLNVRVMGLHIWTGEAASSQSLVAVGVSQMGATLPSMRGVRPSQAGLPASSVAGRHSAPTRVSMQAVVVPDSAGGPPSARASSPTPAVPAQAAQGTSSSVGQQRGGSAEPAPPSVQAPPYSGVRGTHRTMTTLPAQAPPHAARPTVQELQAAARSPLSQPLRPKLPSVGPGRFPESRRQPVGQTPGAPTTLSGFRQALEQGPVTDVDALAQSLVDPLRRAAAAVVLGGLDAAQSSLPDPLGLMEAKGEEQRAQLTSAASACVCALLYELLLQVSAPHTLAVTLVQKAHASTTATPGDIGRYCGGVNNAHQQLVADMLRLLALPSDQVLAKRLDRLLRGVRQELHSCAAPLEARFAHPERQPGTRTG